METFSSHFPPGRFCSLDSNFSVLLLMVILVDLGCLPFSLMSWIILPTVDSDIGFMPLELEAMARTGVRVVLSAPRWLCLCFIMKYSMKGFTSLFLLRIRVLSQEAKAVSLPPAILSLCFHRKTVERLLRKVFWMASAPNSSKKLIISSLLAICDLGTPCS